MKLKDTIIDVSYTLFAQKGYDKTTVADIIKKAGTSKGGFYHHFKSKEEVLETITFSYIDPIKAYHEEILNNQTIDVIHKFTEAFYRLNEIKEASIKDWDKIKMIYNFKGNHVLLQKMGEAFEKETTSFYYQLMLQGNATGDFKIDYPYELAALWSREVIKFHQMSRKLFSGIDPDEAKYHRMLAFNETFINHQLGFDETKIHLIQLGTDYVATMKAAILRKDDQND